MFTLGANSTVGVNTFESAIPLPETYDELQICHNGGSFDETWVVIDGSQVSLDQYRTGGKPSFNPNTIMLAHFDGNLGAGNIINSDLPITHWRIYRRVQGTTAFNFIEEVPNDSTPIYNDITARGETIYEYGIQAVSNGIRGNIVSSEAIDVDFHGWRIYNVGDENTFFSFDTEINSDTLKHNRDRTVFNNFSQFIKSSYGARDYVSGGVKAFGLEFNTDCQIISVGTEEYRSRVSAFMRDRQEKVIKNGSGFAIKVDVGEFTWKYKDILTNQTTGDNSQPYDFSFKFDQTGEVEA